MMFFLLFSAFASAQKAKENGDDDDEREFVYTEGNFIEENMKYLSKVRDIPARSSVAFVATYTNDQPPFFGYLQMLIVLGYSLKIFNPTIDRVVILRQEYRDQPQIVKLIQKSWTHVLFRETIQWPSVFYKDHDVYHAKWFKYWCWTLTQYKKVLIIGCDYMLFSDLSDLFRFQAPASSYLFSDYNIKGNGHIFNSDFMLIEPDMNIFCNLLEMALPYINHETKDRSSLGADDSAPLNLVYRGEIHLLPVGVVHENGGYKHSMLGDARDLKMRVIRACAVHFNGNGKPWKRWTIYSEIWKSFALIIYEKLDLPFKIKGAAPNGDNVFKLVYGDAMQRKRFWSPDMEDEDDEIGDDIYPEIVHSGSRRNASMMFLILFLALLMLKSILRSNNPFNVFIKGWQKKINQFIRLEDENPHPLFVAEDKKVRKKHRHRKKQITP